MSKCYLCGRTMSPKGEVSDCVCHDEHIIPNAIGGRLTSCDILCKKCGSEFGCNEDKAFVNLFACFIHSIEDIMHFDRKHNGVVVKAYNYSDPNKKEVLVNHNEAYPFIPYFIKDEENKIINVWGHKQVTKNYIKQFKNNVDDGYKINVINNIDGCFGAFFSEKNIKFNDSFKKGFVKIAIEFALSQGVSRKNLNLALEINANGKANVLYDRVPMFPYVPYNNPMSMIFEECRSELEDAYPSHSLRLFNIKKDLYCYVDLFSTFQYYVLLGDQYDGEDLDKNYYRSVLLNDKKKHCYSLTELRQLDCSDLDIVTRELKIDVENKSFEEIYKQIVDKQNEDSSNKFSQIIRDAFDNILRTIDSNNDSEYIDPNKILNFSRNIISEFNMSEEEFKSLLYVNNDFKNYLKYNVRLDKGEFVWDNVPDSSNELYYHNIEFVKEYTYKKFLLLQNFCNNHKQEIAWQKFINQMTE